MNALSEQNGASRPPEPPQVHQRDLAGGSLHWWPPTGDHKILFRANPLRFDYFSRYVAGWSGLTMLDVGCGGGYACEFLAQRGAVVAGTDILPQALQQARDHARQEELRIDYRECTTTSLPFLNDSVQAVTCFDVLEHVIDKNAALAEIHRVLQPGGWLFFDTLNRTFTARLLTIWLGEVVLRLIPRGTHDWQHFISPDDLRTRMEGVGFRDVELAGLSLAWRSPGPDRLPFTVGRNGCRAIVYFGAAQKPRPSGLRAKPLPQLASAGGER